ncbi:hypothetical protein D3C86_1544170 [compost metagenome]
MPCQPIEGNILAANNPPRMAPAGKPSNTVVMIVPRCLALPYSAASDRTTGVAPPMPSPAINRSTRICSVVWANAVARDATPNKATEPIIVGRRPNLSPSKPNAIAPSTMPTMPAVRIGANAPAPSPKAWMIEGPVKAIAWVSNPSRMATRKHRTKTRH